MFIKMLNFIIMKIILDAIINNEEEDDDDVVFIR